MMDILPKGCTKAIGIRKMLEVIAISNENCYAFGDELNDLEMLTFVGTGIAMDSSPFCSI